MQNTRCLRNRRLFRSAGWQLCSADAIQGASNRYLWASNIQTGYSFMFLTGFSSFCVLVTTVYWCGIDESGRAAPWTLSLSVGGGLGRDQYAMRRGSVSSHGRHVVQQGRSIVQCVPMVHRWTGHFEGVTLRFTPESCIVDSLTCLPFCET